MIKKILSAVICVALLVSVLPAGIAMSADSPNQATELVDFLTSLGIYGINDNMIYGNEPVTREDLASILSVFYGLTEESYPRETDIPDVMADWSAGHIVTMVDMGILTRYSDGLFRPNDYVTKAALCKVFVTMTGYSFIAESKGGYPQGYVKEAIELDIADGIDMADADAYVTKDELTVMLYNALSVPLLEIVSVGDSNEYEKNENKTLLSENLNIYKAEGLVTALPYVSLDFGNGAGDDLAIVGNTIYKTGVDLYNVLGAECEIYFRQSEKDNYGTILYAAGMDNGKNIIEVMAEDAISFEGKTFRYFDGNKTKDITLSTDFMLIFNGKRLTNYKKEHLLPPQGKIRFCDTDGDRCYDKVIADYEVNYRVSNVKKDDGVFYISNADYKDGLVIGTDESYRCEVFKKGQKVTLSDIKKGDVLSVVAEDIDLATDTVKKTSRVYRINISDTHITGFVTGFDSEGIYVDDVFYELTDEILKDKDSIVLGTDYTFYLNHLGKIASYDETESTINYGLLIDYSEGANGFSDESAVRIFTSNGEFINYDCTEKMILDGKRKKSINDFGKALQKSATQCQLLINGDLEGTLDFSNPNSVYTSYWQVIKYEVSEDGRLLSIDTVAENKSASDSDLKYYGATDATFTWINPVISANVNVQYKETPTNYEMQKRFTLKDNAVLIAMEKLPASEKHFLKYSTGDIVSNEVGLGLSSRGAYILFDPDDMNLCRFMLVAKNGISTKVSGSNIMIYEGTRQKIHTDGETYTHICGTNIANGASVQIPLEDTTLIGNAQPGDLVRWTAGGDGIAFALNTELCRRDNTLDGNSPEFGWRGRWSGAMRFAYARAEAVTDTHLMLRFDEELGEFDLSDNYVGTESEVNTFTETLKFPTSAKYFMYDTETGKTTPAVKEDIRDWRNFGEDADMVAIKAYNSTMQSVVIYR